KGGYRHFMLKEIYEQPRAAADTLRGRVSPEGGTVVLPDIGLDPEIVAGLRRVVLVACGTSYHAALVGRFLIERLAGISAEVDLGSEYRYRDSVLGPETLVVALSQSGETADTLGAVKAARDKGAPLVGLTNVVGSALARYKNFLFLGRGIHYPMALEGALKLKELSYLHAEGYPAGEMKHGPIALIDDGMPVVALAPRDGSYDRMMGTIEEVRARDGRVIALAHEGDREIAARVSRVLAVPVS